MSDRAPAYNSQSRETTFTSDFNRREFHIRQLQNLQSIATLVEVKKFTPKEGSAGQRQPHGMIDVLPLVNMVDGKGKPTKHQNVHNIPYFRLQSGSQAVIMDPQPGDIGLVVFADRDISAVKKTLKQSNPGSRRRNDFADAVFVGVVLTKDKPKEIVQFDNNGTIKVSVDEEKTYVRIKKDEVELKVPGLSIWLRPGRIDLGKKDAPHAVSTVDGPSTKVFAVISESD